MTRYASSFAGRVVARRRAWVAAALVVAVASGVGVAHAQDGPRPGSKVVQWKPCTGQPAADCAKVTVPIDWSKPGGPTIDVAIARRKATDPAARIGVLLVDPGGPAFPGAQMVRGGGLTGLFSAEVHRRFDIVGFDRRGLGDSHKIRCTAVPQPAGITPLPETDEQLRQLTASSRAQATACRAATGPLFDFVDSRSMARDIDAIRAALGERTLTHYETSFGTQVGQEYAELFPSRVRAMVLDSIQDHSPATTRSYLRTTAKAVQDSFDHYVAWCRRSTDCAQHGQDVRRVFAGLYAKAERGELTEPGSTEKIDVFSLLSGTIDEFYGPRWKTLSERLAKLAAAPGQPAAPALPAASPGAGPAKTLADEPGGDEGSGDGNAMTCENLRLPVRDAAELRSLRAEMARLAPDIKMSTQHWIAVLGCSDWPGRVPNPPKPLRWNGVPPVLVLTSRADPATPFEWAQKVARQPGAVLLTYDGAGHQVLNLHSTCINTATNTYLLTGRTPPRGTHCPAVDPPAGT